MEGAVAMLGPNVIRTTFVTASRRAFVELHELRDSAPDRTRQVVTSSRPGATVVAVLPQTEARQVRRPASSSSSAHWSA